MQFTEIGFCIFFVSVFAAYWFMLRRTVTGQNVLLLSASYLFYGWWDWRFLGLIMLTTATTYVTALAARGRHGKAVTAANIVLNLGILAAFKYLGFFSENLRRLTAAFGWNIDWFTIDVLLPVGISFYTFQAIAYSVDVYKGRVEACRNPLAFATFIAYFPQLVAGPIERASSLLSQIESPRRWDYARAVEGCRMVLFGVMKKVCVADILALYVDRFYADMSSPGICLAAGLLFSLEIYFDFSAYSEIARGTSRMLGIELMANFRFPYFSRNVAEFWQRWHISLMNWFRDYLYIPLGGNRLGRGRTILNAMTVFALSGLWHGAAWNFIVWGLYWGVVYVIAKQVFGQRQPKDPISYTSLPAMVATVGFVSFGFYIFRCSGRVQMLYGLSNVWAYALFFAAMYVVALCVVRVIRYMSGRRTLRRVTALLGVAALAAAFVVYPAMWLFALKFWWLLPLALVFGIEWHCRNADYPLALVPRTPLGRLALYWVCFAFIVISEPTDMTFIYFQF